MADLKYVTYCGLYCKHCTQMARIPQQAKTLYDTMKREGFEYFGPSVWPEFKDFWKHLQYLSEFEKTNTGCRAGGCGDPNCRIRVCAGERNVGICVYCDEYPCDRFDFLTRQYPSLLGEGQKLKELGIDGWLEEQEKRCRRGYCFSESRYDADLDTETNI